MRRDIAARKGKKPPMKRRLGGRLAGRITSPGKFEGEEDYAPYFYEQMLDGMVDEEFDTVDGVVDVFRVTPDDRREFPQLRGRDKVAFLNTDQGFYTEVEVPTEEEMEEESSNHPPDEDELRESAVLSDTSYRGGTTATWSGKSLGSFTEFDDALDALRERAEGEGYWPNLYYINDHGNVALLNWEDGSVIEDWV